MKLRKNIKKKIRLKGKKKNPSPTYLEPIKPTPSTSPSLTLDFLTRRPPSPPTQQLAFKTIVDKFTPQDWKQQCRTNLGGLAFPAEGQGAGR